MRITTSIVLFYVWLTASANLMRETGIADALGIATTATAGESFREALEALQNLSGGGIAPESVVSIYTVTTASAEGFLVALTAGPRLMVNLGIPTEFVVFLHAPLGLLAGRYLIYMFSGRDT